MGFFASSGILNQRGFFSAPVSAAPPAPSGIVVATTNQILISDNQFYWGNNSPYDRQGSVGNYYYEFGNSSLQFTEGSWVLIDIGDGFFDFRDATLTNPDLLPFTGWGGRITITAA